MFLLNQPSLNLLERSLSASTLRQQVISNNIANVDTPQFKRSDVKFEEMLHSELDGLSVEGYRSDPRHFLYRKVAGGERRNHYRSAVGYEQQLEQRRYRHRNVTAGQKPIALQCNDPASQSRAEAIQNGLRGEKIMNEIDERL